MSWLDVSSSAMDDDDFPLLLRSIHGMMRDFCDDSLLLEDILTAADHLTGSEEYLLRAIEALHFVADRTPCSFDRWHRVKSSMIQSAILTGEPEIIMETYQYIRDREPKSDTGQWDMYVDDLMLPFDVSDLFDNLELFRLVLTDCCMSPQEEFCRAYSRMYRGTMAAAVAQKGQAAQTWPNSLSGGAQMASALLALADVGAVCEGQDQPIRPSSRGVLAPMALAA